MLTALQVLVPPVQELVPVALARSHCRVDHEGDDALLAMYVGSAVGLAEAFLSRALLTQTLRWVVSDTDAPAPGRPLAGLGAGAAWLGYPFVAPRPLVLPRAPVQAVLQVSAGDGTAPDDVLLATDWALSLGDPAMLRLREGCLSGSPSHVAVTFRAGFGDAPASVPRPVVLAVLLMTAWLYENRGDVAGEMPAAAERLMWPYRMTFLGG